MNSLFKRFILTSVVLLATTVATLAQTDRGTIRGTVADPTGAVLVDAKVTAVNVETGVDTSTVTTEAGTYSIPGLRAGIYRVEAEQAGFKKLIRENVRVDVAGVIGLDLKLEVGETSQEITVNEATPQLLTETSEVKTSISPKAYMDLPLSAGGGRDAGTWMLLAPGVNGSTFWASFNGSQGMTTEIQLDGVSLQTNPNQGDFRHLALPPDAIQELSVATSVYSAEYGNTQGGVTRYTVKSGTNQFHGNLFEYLRNDKLNARGFFNATRSISRQNEFGGTVGGPVIIPKVYDGRNRTFFFTSLSWYRPRSGPGSSLLSVPTAAFKRGDLSELKDPQGNLIQIYDPATTRPDGQGGFIRDPFPGNIIPANRISSVSSKILAFYPDPSRPGIFNNFLPVGTASTNRHDFTIKIDHKFNSKHSVNGVMLNRDPVNTGGTGLPYPLGPEGYRQATYQNNFRISHDWLINPTVLSHRSFGHNDQNDVTTLGSGQTNWSERLGFAGIPAKSNFPIGRVGPYQFGHSLGSGPGEDGSIYRSRTTIYLESLSMVKGKHNLKFGGEWRRLPVLQITPSSGGIYTFNRNETAFPSAGLRGSTGNEFASFLLGNVDQSYLFFSEIETNTINHYIAGYVQDDFKLRPNFTLNVGLRWDLYLPWFEANDNYSVMDPTVPNPAAGGRLGALIFAGNGSGRSGQRRLTDGISWNNFGPRLGFSWAVTPRVVVRSGYGVTFSATTALSGASSIRRNAPGFEATPSFQSQDQGLTPAFNWSNGHPNFTRPPFIDPGFGVGGFIHQWNDNSREPLYKQDWHFGLQYQLGSEWLLDVAYVGNKGTRIPTNSYNLNQVHSRYLSLGDLLLKPINDPAVVSAGFARPYPGFNGSLAQALRPFPQYSGVGTLFSALVGNSTYNSLQVKLDKQFANGLFFLSSYTWAKYITDSPHQFIFSATSARDHYNRRLEKALSNYDLSHRLTTAFVYELPLGPGKPVARNLTGAAAKILGGWQVTGSLQYQSGQPLVIGAPNTLPLFNSSNLPNVVPGVDQKIAVGDFDPAKNLYLNINAFQLAAPFTFGNAPAVLSVRDFPLYNENIGIIKRTYINETANIEFRFEMFNAFNRVRFGGIATNVGNPFNFGRVGSQANSPRTGQFALVVNF